jgi:hypothetical protein
LGAFAPQADGSVWVGTSNGLARFTPHREPEKQPPSVVFTDLRLATETSLGRMASAPAIAKIG